MTWEVIPLGEFITLKRGYDLPATNRVNGHVPVVSSSGITGHHNVAKVEGPGVVTGRYGTLGEVFFIADSFWPLNTSLYVHDFKGNDPQFSAYFLKTVLPKRSSDKAAVPGVNRNDLHKLLVRATRDTDKQRTIASILSAYDDLIENNRRRIELLEDAARMLHREWFVHFRFPGHEYVNVIGSRPEGWEMCEVGDILELRYGKALKERDRIEGPFPVYGSSGIVGTHRAALVEGPAIIIGRKGNVGSVYWSSTDFWPIDTVYFIPKDMVDCWLYLTLRSVRFQNTDASVPGLNRNYAYSRKVMHPNGDLRRLFNEFVAPIFSQHAKLENYNRKLVQTRDMLLLRLMSGEIAV